MRTLFGHGTALLRAVAAQLLEIRLIGMAAEIAFYQLLGFFPFLLFCVFLLSRFPQEGLLELALDLFAGISPDMVNILVSKWLDRAYSLADYTLLSFFGVGIIWAGSAGIGALIDAFSTINRRRREITLIRSAILQVAFTLAGGAALVIILLLWVLAPALAGQLAAAAGFDAAWHAAWFLIRWPLVTLLVVSMVAVIYHALSVRARPLRWSFPGALVAALLFAGASQLFAHYIRNLAVLSVTFGTLSVIIVLMLWLQMLNLAMLVGEVVNHQCWCRFGGGDDSRCT